MGFRLPGVVSAKQLLRRSSSNGNQTGSALVADVPKGYLAVYVGAESNTKRFVIPVSFLNQPSFQELLNQVEEANRFDHPIMGGLTIPCTEDSFIDLISRLNA